MKIKNYRKIILVLSIILLLSIWYCFNIIKMYKQNQINSVNIEKFGTSIGQIKKHSNLKDKNNKKQLKNDEFILSDFYRYNLEANYKQVIKDKNIFDLIEKKQLSEPQLKPMKNIKVNSIEKKHDNLEKQEATIKAVLNPFCLQAVSINKDDKMAIIVNQENLVSYLIKPGDIIAGYLVKTINFENIVMEKNAQKIVVEFSN